MAETLPHDKRAVFDYLTPIIDLSMVTQSMALLSLKVWRETNSHSSWEREAVLSLHDIYMWHRVEHLALWVYHCSITHVFLWPFWAILGRRALDMLHPKCIILFADVTSLNDTVTSYVMSQHCRCIGHVTIYYHFQCMTILGIPGWMPTEGVQPEALA